MASTKYEQSSHRKELNRQWHQSNKEKQNSRSLAHYYKNKEKCQTQASDWRKAHLEYSREKDRKRYLRRREEQIQRAIQWRKNNPERARVSNLNHKLKNKEKNKVLAVKWSRNNPHKRAFYNNRYRSVKAKASINLKSINAYLKRVRSKPFFRCYYCEKTFASSAVHFDHIVPLSKGGPHSVENLCTSCGSCNSSKKNKQIGVWIKSGQQILAL